MPTNIYEWIAWADYCALATVALFGAFCCVLVWSRVGQKWFKSEDEQNAFIDGVEADLAAGNFDSVAEACEGDPRAVPMLINLGVMNRHLGHAKVRALLMERFQRDVLADMEKNISWVITVVKTAPMLGLFGTVTGMIGAFDTLASAESVEATLLAKDINTALYTTAIGLAIAIPLVMAMNAVNNRIRHMEELVGSGVTRFLEAFRVGLSKRK
ncbi:MAG: MotA/TolQ/ExbB proton channel family protein [Planctomycetota bacterium]|nr:MotA/TolQ/ExbB proton channel family protein [Planctomycetota bacterium]